MDERARALYEAALKYGRLAIAFKKAHDENRGNLFGFEILKANRDQALANLQALSVKTAMDSGK